MNQLEQLRNRIKVLDDLGFPRFVVSSIAKISQQNLSAFVRNPFAAPAFVISRLEANVSRVEKFAKDVLPAVNESIAPLSVNLHDDRGVIAAIELLEKATASDDGKDPGDEFLKLLEAEQRKVANVNA